MNIAHFFWFVRKFSEGEEQLLLLMPVFLEVHGIGMFSRMCKVKTKFCFKMVKLPYICYRFPLESCDFTSCSYTVKSRVCVQISSDLWSGCVADGS